MESHSYWIATMARHTRDPKLEKKGFNLQNLQKDWTKAMTQKKAFSIVFSSYRKGNSCGHLSHWITEIRTATPPKIEGIVSFQIEKRHIGYYNICLEWTLEGTRILGARTVGYFCFKDTVNLNPLWYDQCHTRDWERNSRPLSAVILLKSGWKHWTGKALSFKFAQDILQN